MKKFLTAALSVLVLPMAASASSINLSAAVVSVNKSVAVANNGTYGAATTSAVVVSRTPCFGGACGDPIGCPTSPENPTALLGILGATGLLLGRIGYGRLRNRQSVSAVAA